MIPSGMASRSTFRTRMRAIILATSTVALVMASGAFLIYDTLSFHRAIEDRLRLVSSILAPKVAATLSQRDGAATSEVLNRLSTTPLIVSSAVFAEDGSIFSRYLRADAPDDALPAKPAADGFRKDHGDVALFHPLILNGRRLGTMYVRMDVSEGALRLQMNLAIVGLTIVAILLVSNFLASRLVGTITGPLAAIAEIVQAVSTRRDYSLRAQKKGPEELGILIEGINDMLSQIQVRDGALQLARNELGNRVQERTAELTFVNQELSTEIAGRKKVEDSLRESEERYRQLVELSPDAIMIHRDGRFLFVNGAALRLFGAKNQNELVGATLMDRVAPEYRQIIQASIRKVTQENLATPPLEQELLRLDGSPVDVELQGSPLIFQGEPAVQIVIRDISKRKEIERMKDEFVSTVSHELRTPLTSIQGSLGLVANGVTGTLPPAAKPLVDIAFKNCSRLILLINDILDSEKIAAGKMKFAFREQELMPLLEHAIESNRAFGAQFSVRFELGDTVPGAKVDVDSDRLIQVLTNLLSNAAKFSPKGDVVTVSARRAGARLAISVSDRGPGIPPEFHNRIFQKFSQADSSDRRAKGGTGLGLSISKAIVERHSGCLTFVSEPGRGTTFIVELPEKSRAPVPPPASAPRAIVCDDEPQVAELVRTVLEREQFRTVVAQTLQEVRELLAKEPAALLTLDLLLPDGNGVEFIRELRKSDAHRSLPVLVISPLARSAREMAGDGLGRVSYLDKPVDIIRLGIAAREAVSPLTPAFQGAKS